MRALSQRVLADKTNAPRSLVEQLIEKEEANFEARNHHSKQKDDDQEEPKEACPMIEDDVGPLSRKRLRSPCKPHPVEEADLSSPLAQRPRIVISSSASPDLAGIFLTQFYNFQFTSAYVIIQR